MPENAFSWLSRDRKGRTPPSGCQRQIRPSDSDHLRPALPSPSDQYPASLRPWQWLAVWTGEASRKASSPHDCQLKMIYRTNFNIFTSVWTVNPAHCAVRRRSSSGGKTFAGRPPQQVAEAEGSLIRLVPGNAGAALAKPGRVRRRQFGRVRPLPGAGSSRGACSRRRRTDP